MKRMAVFGFVIMVWGSSIALAQNVDPLNFYPHNEGNVWQYRSMFTNELIRTQYIDSVVVDSISRDRIVYGRSVTGTTLFTRERIDSFSNVYNLNFQADYVRYKLYADSGESWQAGVVDDTIPVVVTVLYVYQAYVFGIPTTVKVFRFVVQNPPPQGPFSLGSDHLAGGFGLVKTEIEPSDVYYLAGAIIENVHYGTIVSVKEKGYSPPSFDLLENYPNPFNPTTTIRYQLPSAGRVSIKIYNILGQQIRNLVDGIEVKGSHNSLWDGRNDHGVAVSGGVYFYRIESTTLDGSQSLVATKKMLLVE